MDKLNQKYQKLTQALQTLEKAINFFSIFVKEGKSHNPHMNYDEEYRTFRDSEIQRFKYSVDLFWKYLKKNLEVKHLEPEIKAPAETIRKSYSAGIINEDEAEKIIEMIKERNKTSHIYVEEIAEELIKKIPQYYQIMNNVSQRLKPKNA